MDDAARESYEDAGPWTGAAARPRNACANHEDCGNLARPGKGLCHTCRKRLQRRSRRRVPRFASPWERLVAAALRYSGAEGDEEYEQAAAVLRSAALRYARCYVPGKRRAPEAPKGQLPLL